MDVNGKELWDRVCATITRLGHPRPYHTPPFLFKPPLLPESYLDLHGHTLQNAYQATKQFLSRDNAPKFVTVITGKSGEINREFPFWLENMPRVQRVEKANDGGAYWITLRQA